jgi:hypothetical protein
MPLRPISARQPVWRRASWRSSRSSGAIWASIASIMASAISIRSRASAGSSSRSKNARPSSVRSFSGVPPMPWWNSVAWMRCIHWVRSSTSVCRSRVRDRHWRTCSGGIQDSGNRPSATSARPHGRSSRPDLHPIGCSRAPSLCLCTGRNASGQVALPWVVAKRAPRRHRLRTPAFMRERGAECRKQRHEILGGPKPALIRRPALSAWSRTWSAPRRRETSGSPPGSGSPSCPGP